MKRIIALSITLFCTVAFPSLACELAPSATCRNDADCYPGLCAKSHNKLFSGVCVDVDRLVRQRSATKLLARKQLSEGFDLKQIVKDKRDADTRTNLDLEKARLENERLMLENEQLKRSTTTQSVSLSRDQFTKIMENEFKTKVEGIGNISTSMANLLERVENEDKQESRESLLKIYRKLQAEYQKQSAANLIQMVKRTQELQNTPSQ
jgi:hypothetical protein|tara:strand:- start:156 stop:779 length:624 start_codon:yes stop_codon:yes gene_type:complete